jgi:hypothetical protein
MLLTLSSAATGEPASWPERARGATTAAHTLPAITLKQRSGGDRGFVDAAGREVVLHGTNVIVKGPPWLPATNRFSRDISLVDEDFERMRKVARLLDQTPDITSLSLALDLTSRSHSPPRFSAGST